MIGEPQLLTGRTHDIIIVAPKPSDSIVVCFFIALEGRRGGRGSLTDFMEKNKVMAATAMQFLWRSSQNLHFTAAALIYT